MPTLATNAIERITGVHDERLGRASIQVALAGERVVRAGLRSLSRGDDFVAKGSSVLGKILPLAGMALGVAQVWKGWNELEHKRTPLDLVHSRSGRSGLLHIAASAMWFVPGVGGALSGAALRAVAAANELDAFAQLDRATVPVERQGEGVARRVHPLDPTPVEPADTLREGLAARRTATA